MLCLLYFKTTEKFDYITGIHGDIWRFFTGQNCEITLGVGLYSKPTSKCQ